MEDEQPEGTNRPPFSNIFLAAILGDVAAAILAYILILAGPNADYGWPLFFLLPFIAGFITGTFLKKRGHSAADVAVSSLVANLFAAAILLVIALEGMVCVFMAFPITFLSHYLAALIGGAIAVSSNGDPISISFLVLAPFVYASETLSPNSPTTHVATTRILVNASPEQIWPFLSNLNSIGEAQSRLLFKAGVAHPLSTKTEESGVGANRFCVLSTGVMSEKVTVWQPARRLAFEVLSTPPTMKEWNPFGEVKAEHLTGYYTCRRGEFILNEIGEGRTEIVGTSVYEHRFGPTWYWTLWTDYVVHNVHASVLEEIKTRAEAGQASLHE